MNIRSIFNFKGSTMTCLVLSILFFGLIVYNQLTLHNLLPEQPVQIVLTQKMNLEAPVGKENTTVSLSKGDTLSVLGYRNGGITHAPQLLVETRNGMRGFVSTIDLEYGHYIKKNESFDTITIIGKAGTETSPKIKVRYADGKEQEYGYSSLRPILPDSIDQWEFNEKGWYYMSKAKFERLYLGKTLAEADGYYRPHTTAVQTKEGWIVSFDQIQVFDKNQGKFLAPMITYNDSLIATSYDLLYPYGNNAWVLKWWPLTETIIDCDLFASLIQSSFYEHHTFGKDFTLAGGDKPWWAWALAGLYILLALMWLVCTPMIPATVMGAALQNRYSFYHLSDTVVEFLITAATAIAAYIWLTLLLTWGLLWFVALPLIFAAFIAAGIAISPLNTSPHHRCLGCRRLYTMNFQERVWGETYERWEMVTEKGNLLHQEHSSYKTWTETTYSNGTTSKSNEKTHHVTDSTYAIHHYNVLFRYHPYDDLYKCRSCGYIEKIHAYQKEELQREYKSSGTTTITTES